jgi:hypothetical protein
VNLAHELGANGYAVKPTGLVELERLASAMDGFWLQRHCYPTLGAAQPENGPVFGLGGG